MGEREHTWATQVEMAIPASDMYPTVVIRDIDDARDLVDILSRNGVAVNLRSVQL